MLLAKLHFIWQNLSVQAFLDIFLLTGGFYFLYRTFRATGTWKIFVGILVATLFFVVARVLELRGIMWVYNWLSPILLIGAIILFQPELRKILERAASIRGRRYEAEDAGLATVIADGLRLLCERKWGAIFVFPGRAPLAGWISGGVDLDATPSLPLILSIFDPHSPGHDGAVIVDKGGFAKFAVRLPLTDSEKLSSSYGTRHNASLGLSEKTDALVISVSEERGTASIFHHGKMTTLEKPEDISTWLMEHWKATAAFGLAEPRVKKGSKEAAGLLGSAIAAVALWVWVVLPQTEIIERVVDVSLEYQVSPALAMVGERPSSAKLHVAGEAVSIGNLEPSKIRVKLDLLNAQPGTQKIVISDENVELPRDIRLLDVDPPDFDVTLNALKIREVPVNPQLVGTLPEGLRLEKVIVNPATVSSVAPDDLDPDAEPLSLSTTPIYLQGIASTSVLTAKIIAPANISPPEGIKWPDVEVQVHVRAK